LVFSPGAAGQLRRATFTFADRPAFDAHRSALQLRGLSAADWTPEMHQVTDPAGHLLRFLAPAPQAASAAVTPSGGAGRLQHFALRTPDPQTLADFYVDLLGFVVSDRVRDEQGRLTAVFLRSDAEHHVLALFRSAEARFDHFSCEVADWIGLRDGADHLAREGITLAWGVGRHGPGNDTFWMVRDVDGNMGELSAELEVCAPGRPAGEWPHHPQTLNQWGLALMRC
jgi:catechol 2,3-dioxygenase-like lactoylglutathione lyase family enzyme